ncbi:hypothetical protein GBA65_12575 [Rubrobacter marinus]|uniref:Uncharacterized protein n=1 Tax=Rubrobacter marinus TaxID=2653852 RepID=A0A6G8PYE7_9ACTN|nr:hypothetical protein [Rubrobacter marinus]QIN79216.1 hypothetical protein GBA65_12575 [Rubrobacter marinus]
MAKEESGVEEIIPGLIVRHTNRRLGRLELSDACERLICGKISFSEFVDQVGEGFRELLDFMMEHDLHPGRPEEVVYCVDCYADFCCRETIRSQLGELYRMGAARVAGAKAS